MGRLEIYIGVEEMDWRKLGKVGDLETGETNFYMEGNGLRGNHFRSDGCNP